jgi:hypothetical protein
MKEARCAASSNLQPDRYERRDIGQLRWFPYGFDRVHCDLMSSFLVRNRCGCQFAIRTMRVRLPPPNCHEGSIAATHTRQLMCEFRYFYK